jgi:hypothetical protein
MAKKVVTTIELTDDVDGGKADQTLTFTWNGVDYEIDLSKKNAAALHRAMKPYVDAARRVPRAGTRKARTGRGSRGQARDLSAIREWARANGYAVSDRGRIPKSAMEAFDAAH